SASRYALWIGVGNLRYMRMDRCAGAGAPERMGGVLWLNKSGKTDCLQHCLRIAYVQLDHQSVSPAKSGWWGRKDSNLRSHEAADLQFFPSGFSNPLAVNVFPEI